MGEGHEESWFELPVLSVIENVSGFAGSPTAPALAAAVEPLLTLTERPGDRVAATEES